MRLELIRSTQQGTARHFRIDSAKLTVPSPSIRTWANIALIVMVIGFAFFGAANLELGPFDARLGLAAGEPMGPLGQVYGYWAPDLWPGRVALAKIASFVVDGNRLTPATVLWPAALAAGALGCLLARRLMQTAHPRMGLWFGLCWLGCLGVVDHSGSTGLDFLSGLVTVAAIDRLLTQGSDLRAGLWAGLAFLVGGWPPVVVILLAVIVISRYDATFSPRLLIPPLLAVGGWSIWAFSAASAEAWAAALTWPLTQRPDWWLAPGILGLGLPLAPFALLALSREFREDPSNRARQLLLGWLQVALACLIAGTIVPGVACAARVPALAGVLVSAAAGLDSAWRLTLPPFGRRIFFTVFFGLTAIWLLTQVYGGYVWTLVFPYYRPVGIVVLLLGVAYFLFAWFSIGASNTRRAVIALMLLAVSVKLVHWGYYVPEWNYRHGQGPWGRAIGQWLLRNWTVYTVHEWPTDLAFAIGRPVRKLRSEQHLAYPSSREAKHVLLLESEFEHWPENAPRLMKVATFHDEDGRRRILARTEGVLVTPTGSRLPDEENR